MAEWHFCTDHESVLYQDKTGLVGMCRVCGAIHVLDFPDAVAQWISRDDLREIAGMVQRSEITVRQ